MFYFVTFAVLLLFNVYATEAVDRILSSDVDPALIDYKDTKIVFLKNVKIHEIPKNYFRDLKLDLSTLSITNSRLGKIHEEAFDGLDHLHLLVLSDNEITKLEPRTFTRLKGLEILQLESNKLKDVSLVLKNVQEIVLARNGIENLQEHFIVGDSVTFLDLSWNNLKKLEHSMKSLSKLSTINISNNQITDINPEVFAENENLDRVFASGNRLTSTEGLRLKQMKILDLSLNRLTHLDNESFAEMLFLDELLLNGNRISQIDDAFTETKHLRTLDLSDNLLTELDPGMFRNNPYLSELRLSKNKITVLKPFETKLQHLTVLNLSHNNLESIDSGFFRLLDKLEILDLSFNKLTKIGNVLSPLTRLVTLDLSFNAVVLDRNTTRSNFKLSRLNLSSNGLDMSLSFLGQNNRLQLLDLSKNNITNFCDVEMSMDSLSWIDLSDNQIREVSCFKDNNLLPSTLIDIRNNPLTCNADFDDVIAHFVSMKAIPHKIKSFDIRDVESESYRFKTSLDLWNAVKRKICPDGLDIHMKSVHDYVESEEKEDDDDDENSDYYDYDIHWESDYYYKTPHQRESTEATNNGVEILEVPFDELSDGIKNIVTQSERESWDSISKMENVAQEYDDEVSNMFHISKSQLNVFTITLIFIGVALILVLANAIIFMIIRMRGWNNDFRGDKRYTHLENKVYRDTTVPNDYASLGGKKEENYRINCARMFTNFGFKSNEDDTESVKRMIVDTAGKVEV